MRHLLCYKVWERIVLIITVWLNTLNPTTMLKIGETMLNYWEVTQEYNTECADHNLVLPKHLISCLNPILKPVQLGILLELLPVVQDRYKGKVQWTCSFREIEGSKNSLHYSVNQTDQMSHLGDSRCLPLDKAIDLLLTTVLKISSEQFILTL